MDIILSLKNANPTESKAELFVKFQASLRGQPTLQRAVDWYYFTSMVDCAGQDKKDAKRLNVTAEVTKKVKSVRNRVLMDMLLPSGRKLKHVTFQECEDAGGWFSTIATMGKASQIVGETLLEEDLPDFPRGPKNA